MTLLTQGVRALLEGRNFAHLASVLPDGSPHSVPIWIGVEGDRIVFLTQAGSRKARNVDRDSRVALPVLDHDNPYRNVQLRGRVVETRRGEDAFPAMDAVSRRYTGADFPMRGAETVMYVVEVDSARLVDLPFRH